MHKFVICLGSNLAPCDIRVSDAVARLGHYLSVDRESHGYITPSHNGIGNDYYNVVILGRTDVDYQNLYAVAKRIERDLGRTEASAASGVMPIDIDIVIFDDVVVKPDDFIRRHFTIGYSVISEP